MRQGGRQVVEPSEWEVNLATRELRADGVAVPIGSRAFEIVELLARSAGELVTKDDLMRHVWPGAIVEDNTIQVHISAIRKALGTDRGMLKTVSGRGYRLLGNWTTSKSHTPLTPDMPEHAGTATGSFQTNVPVAASALIGRETAVQRLCDLLSAYRAVTLTGPGGIGKTVLASEAARRLLPTIESDVLFVELVSLSDPALVSSAVANVLGLRLGGAEISPASVARAIGGGKVLLVLDNCEHVIDAAAALAETLLRMCPNATVLATSREVLRIEGEFAYHVPPLEVPSPPQEAAGDVLEHSAVQLFLARVRSLQADSLAHGRSLPIIGAICRRLDGIPLAIEFAAARAATLGVQQVARGLDDRFALLTSSRRTALPRHQTLRATLDWSYELLPEVERRLLRRLTVFPGGFTLEAAMAVASDDGAVPAIIDGISNLVEKSLVTLDESTPAVRWRLLETTRAYAREKLGGSGESARMARRHAEYYRDLFARAESEVLARPTREWLADYARDIDNLRSAIDWAFSSGAGDISVGIALTAVTVPLWISLSLMEECRRRVERALSALIPTASTDARLEMKLYSAWGASKAYNSGAASAGEEVWARALHLAQKLGDVDHQLRSLWGLWLQKDREALALAQQFFAVAVTPADRVFGELMIGTSVHYLGDLKTAQHHLEHVIAHEVAHDAGWGIVRFQVDQRLMMRAFQTRVLWLRGFPEQAVDVARDAVEDARVAEHVITLCRTVARAGCPVALWVGDLDLAETYINLLQDAAIGHGLTLWSAFAKAYRCVLLIARGDVRGGLSLLRDVFDEFGPAVVGYRTVGFRGEFALALGRAGQVAEGLASVTDAIDRCEHTKELWIIAELLRIKGNLFLLEGAQRGLAHAEDHFRHALDWARRQGALSWELRAATDLARLQIRRDRFQDARQILEPVYNRFTEGFATADARLAKELLSTLPT